tara:strand:+ start:2504 stop:2926 length:423 start_codon:yes stop_codon:yes gene_type:complete
MSDKVFDAPARMWLDWERYAVVYAPAQRVVEGSRPSETYRHRLTVGVLQHLQQKVPEAARILALAEENVAAWAAFTKSLQSAVEAEGLRLVCGDDGVFATVDPAECGADEAEGRALKLGGNPVPRLSHNDRGTDPDEVSD